MRKSLGVLIGVTAVLTVGFATPAHATGPLYNCESGRAWVWRDGGRQIPFNPDQGRLGSISNADAVQLVQSAFDVWGAVPTSTAGYVNAGALPEDVDEHNFVPWFFPDAPDDLSPIVFDDTGLIFNQIFGSQSGVLGFAGPEWGNEACELTEGSAFLNGPAFTNLTEAMDVMVHEFGHYTNLAHSVVNGQTWIGDSSGPSGYDTFGTPASVTVVETMYPFYFGAGSDSASLEADDIAGVSTLYPEAGYLASTGSIKGTIYATDGTTRLSGINVIARNVANPFEDAVSAISGDYTFDTEQSDPVVGTFAINGLTPGATYAVYIDRLVFGGFSTDPITMAVPEEFHSGAAESNNVETADPPATFAGVTVQAGTTATGIDVILNQPRPGEPIPLGDDGVKEVALPFTFQFCGIGYDKVWINGNGSLTFGRHDFNYFPTTFDHLIGPPRIAALWTDLNPALGGRVVYEQTESTFTVTFTDVPSYPTFDRNTFAITLNRISNRIDIEYGALGATDGLAGLSCGGRTTTGFEPESDLSRLVVPSPLIKPGTAAAVFEWFNEHDNDLAGLTLRFKSPRPGRDSYEPNDTFAEARRVRLPYSSLDRFTAIEPKGEDVDYFEVRLRAGTTFVAQTIGIFTYAGLYSSGFNTLLGLFDAEGNLIASNDDAGDGSWFSRLSHPIYTTGTYYLAVTGNGDRDFSGHGLSGGRYVLNMSSHRGLELGLDDDDFAEIPLGFAFPFQGRSYTSVFVNSNGNLTFGAGDFEWVPTVAGFLEGPPRIAPMWMDLAPMYGGSILIKQGPGTWTVEFADIPEIGTISSTATFSVTLTSTGRVDVKIGNTGGRLGPRRLTGITAGGGVPDPGETDFSAVSNVLPVSKTVYEYFSHLEFDLSFRNLFFVP